MMDKKKARRNLLTALGLIAASLALTFGSLAYIRFFMMLPR